MPSKYVPGQVSQSLLGGQSGSVDNKLDDLFKHSAGPSEVATLSPIRPVTRTLSKEQAEKTTKALAKKALEASKVTQALEKKRRAEEEGEGNSAKKVAVMSRREKQAIEGEKNKRTVFIGNVSIDCMTKTGEKEFKKKFAQYGKIESMRFRSVAFSEQIPRKTAFITRKLHAKCESANAYILYKDETMAIKALEMNGQLFMDRHLCVDSEAEKRPHDRKRSVFLGGLPIDVQEEELWTFFADCGDIESVRTPRDKKTNIGKGFGYIQFKERSSVAMALALEGKDFREGTKVRIQRCKIPLSEGGTHSTPKTKSAKDAVSKKTRKYGKSAPSASVFEGTRATKDAGKGFNLPKTSRKVIGKKTATKKSPKAGKPKTKNKK